jgi:hypothetical protein
MKQFVGIFSGWQQSQGIVSSGSGYSEKAV